MNKLCTIPKVHVLYIKVSKINFVNPTEVLSMRQLIGLAGDDHSLKTEALNASCLLVSVTQKIKWWGIGTCSWVTQFSAGSGIITTVLSLLDTLDTNATCLIFPATTFKMPFSSPSSPVPHNSHVKCKINHDHHHDHVVYLIMIITGPRCKKK